MKLVFQIVAGGLLSVAAIALSTPPTIAAPPAVNQGRIYWVNNGVPTPISDNLIQFIPCAPFNNCQQFQSYRKFGSKTLPFRAALC